MTLSEEYAEGRAQGTLMVTEHGIEEAGVTLEWLRWLNEGSKDDLYMHGFSRSYYEAMSDSPS